MRKATRALLPLFCLLAAACGDDDGGDGDDDGDDDGGVERRLVLFHTNDEHSHLFGFAPEIDDYPLPTEPGDGSIVGSIARRVELLDQERAALDEEGIDSLTVSAGDQTQGALPQIAFETSSPDFTLMAEAGYDIMCPGNHEFNLGPEAYAAAIEAVGPDMPPVVSTNIAFSAEDEGDDTLAALFGEGLSDAPITPYRILETPGGIRVGFVGIMGVNAQSVAPNKVPVEFSADLAGLYATIQPAVNALRDQDVNLVVALSHSGVNLATPANGEDFNIAQNVEGIDIIVSGHTHTEVNEAIIAVGPDDHEVPIVQTGSYGRFLGRVELVLPADGGRPTLATSELIPVDDTIVPSDDSITSQLDALIADLEATALPAQISRIEGVEVTDDPKMIGDLYYRDMGSTDFDIIGLRSRTETNMLNLSNDAKLAAAEEFFGPTDIAIEASGTVRDDILVGESGVLSYADLFRVFPLGENPFDGGSIGYPLVRFKINLFAVRAALEVGVSVGYVNDSFYLSVSGLFVEYDTSLEPLDTSNLGDVLDASKGRITRIVLDVNKSGTLDETDIAIFDRARPGDGAWNSTAGDISTLYSVVTTLYIGSFADDNSIPLYDDLGDPVNLVDTILTRDDGSDVKDYEAFIGHILTLTAENKGVLPTIYDENTVEGETPRHMLCDGPLCVK